MGEDDAEEERETARHERLRRDFEVREVMNRRWLAVKRK